MAVKKLPFREYLGNYSILFLIFFGPLRRVMNTYFPIKKSIFFFRKNGCEETSFSEISRKLLNIFSWLFPKGEFLRTHRVGPIGLSGSLSLSLLVVNFDQPTNRVTYLVGVVGWWVWWGVLPPKIFMCLNSFFFNQFFFKQLQLIVGTIFF